MEHRAAPSPSASLVAGLGALGLLAAGLTAMPLWVVIVSLFLLASGVAISSPPATTLALVEYPQIAGTASSLLGMVRFGFGGVAAPLVGVAGALSILPLGVVTTVAVLLAGAAYLVLARRPISAAPTTADPARIPSTLSNYNKENTTMRGVIMHAPGDVRVEDRENPAIIEPTDAIIRVAASCICGSDLWPYRGAEPVDHMPMGHEYVGVVTEIGADVKNVKVGDFVVGSFFASDNTCEICQAGYQSRCVHATGAGSAPRPSTPASPSPTAPWSPPRASPTPT